MVTLPLKPTSDGQARYTLHEMSVPIQVPVRLADGTLGTIPGAVDATRASDGSLPLHPQFVEKLDRRTLRPIYLAFARAHFWSEELLAAVLPLTVPEARDLLKRRHPKWSAAVEECLFGEWSHTEHGQRCVPVIGKSTVFDRKHAGIDMLRKWTNEGAGPREP